MSNTYNYADAVESTKDIPQSEREEIKTMASNAASKTVLHIIAKALIAKNCQGVADRVAAFAFTHCSSVSISFEYEGGTWKVCSSLTPTSADYKNDIALPPSFTKFGELIEQFNLLKLVAVTYWEHFKTEHADLYKEIKAILGDLDIVEVTDNLTVMRFENALDADRIGIFSYIVDPTGKVLVPNSKKG